MPSFFLSLRFPSLLRALALPAALLAGGCSSLDPGGLFDSLQKPSIQSITPKITGLDWKGVDMAFDVGVKNPWSVPLKTPKFDYQLAIADQPLLSEAKASGIDLPASGTGIASLPVHLNYTDIWKTAAKLKDSAEIPYSLKGNLLFSPLGKEVKLPLEKSGTVPVLHPPSFSDIAVAEPQISGGEAKVGLDMTVVNPNIFELGLQNLGYAMKIGDVEIGSIQASAPKALGAGQSQRVHLAGAITGLSAIGKLVAGGKIGAPKVNAVGSIQTPYGAIKMP